MNKKEQRRKSIKNSTLNSMRKALKGKVEQLVLCKGELFYCVKGKFLDDTVWPVSHNAAEEESKFFKVPWSEE